MKELSVMQMEKLQGGDVNVYACVGAILVGAYFGLIGFSLLFCAGDLY